MFRKIVDIKKEVAVLDLGTNTICAAIIRGERKEQDDVSFGLGGEMRVLGVGYQLSKGIKNGTITNLEELEESMLGAIASAEDEAEKSIKSVFVALPPWAMQSHAVETSMDIGQLPVDEIHLSTLLNFDTSKYIDEHREVVHIFPVSYSIDDNSGIQDPIGMVGEKLSAILHVVSAPSSLLKNIRNCLNRNNIEVSGFIDSTYASVLSTALNEEVLSGVTVVDMGGTTTSIACMHDGILLYLGLIPLGSQNITNDIATVLRTTKSSAERLKILYGVSESSVDEESILVSRVDEYGEEHVQNISKGMLDSIISARLEEILDKTQDHIYNCGADKVLYQTIVITGGGSRLSGLNEFIKSKKYFSDVAVRLGKPIGTTGSHDFVKSPSFSTAAGTALYCLGEFSGKSLQNDEKSLWQRLMIWFKRGV